MSESKYPCASSYRGGYAAAEAPAEPSVGRSDDLWSGAPLSHRRCCAGDHRCKPRGSVVERERGREARLARRSAPLQPGSGGDDGGGERRQTMDLGGNGDGGVMRQTGSTEDASAAAVLAAHTAEMDRSVIEGH